MPEQAKLWPTWTRARHHERVERGAAPLGAGDAGVLVDAGHGPAALLRDGAKLVELKPDILTVAGGGHAGVEGGSDGLVHPRGTSRRTGSELLASAAENRSAKVGGASAKGDRGGLRMR